MEAMNVSTSAMYSNYDKSYKNVSNHSNSNSQQEYKERIDAEIAKIPFHSSHRKDTEYLTISDEAYAAMEADPEYEQWVLQHIRENRGVNLSMMTNRSDYLSGTDYEYIGATKEECHGESYNQWDHSKDTSHGSSKKVNKKKDLFDTSVDYQERLQQAAMERKQQTQERNEEYQCAVYNRETVQDQSFIQESLKEKILGNLKGATELELIPVDENLPHEIYAISISEGKVHVQGGKGYEDKASAYEKLLNASMGYALQWHWKGGSMDEETVLSRLTDMLDYYMDYDQKVHEADHSDSIVNHVNDAFDSWFQENRPQGHFRVSM